MWELDLYPNLAHSDTQTSVVFKQSYTWDQENWEQNTKGGIDLSYCCYCNQESLCVGRREKMKKKKEEGVGGRAGGGEENIILMALCLPVPWAAHKPNRSPRRALTGEMPWIQLQSALKSLVLFCKQRNEKRERNLPRCQMPIMLGPITLCLDFCLLECSMSLNPNSSFLQKLPFLTCLTYWSCKQLQPAHPRTP